MARKTTQSASPAQPSPEQLRDLGELDADVWDALFFGSEAQPSMAPAELKAFLDFGRGTTPHGKKAMCGTRGTGKLTHFWTRDDRWQPMPTTYALEAAP